MQKNKEKDLAMIIQATCVYIGIILGAGFASGQEIIKFFVSYGKRGMLGLILSGVVFGLSGWAIMDICARLNIKTYSEFLKTVFGNTLGKLIEFIATIFILILFCAMLAGAGAMASQSFGINFTIGVILVSIVCFITFMFDLQGIVKINLILSPFLVIGGIFFGLYSFFTEYIPAFFNVNQALKTILSSWIVSALTYSSYNIITAVSVLSEMSSIVKNRRIAKYAGIFGGLCLMLLGICFALPLFLNQELVQFMELPMLAIARQHGDKIEIIYILMLIAAIMTTAVSTGFSVIEWISNIFDIPKQFIKIGLLIFGIVFAHVGFSNFVGTIYPVFAYIGLFEIITIIIFFLTGPKE